MYSISNIQLATYCWYSQIEIEEKVNRELQQSMEEIRFPDSNMALEPPEYVEPPPPLNGLLLFVVAAEFGQVSAQLACY